MLSIVISLSNISGQTRNVGIVGETALGVACGVTMPRRERRRRSISNIDPLSLIGITDIGITERGTIAIEVGWHVGNTDSSAISDGVVPIHSPIDIKHIPVIANRERRCRLAMATLTIAEVVSHGIKVAMIAIHP